MSHTIFWRTILRLKDIMIAGNRFLLTNQGKLLTQDMFFQELTLVSHWNPWVKIIKYRNIFLPFYCNFVRKYV